MAVSSFLLRMYSLTDYPVSFLNTLERYGADRFVTEASVAKVMRVCRCS